MNLLSIISLISLTLILIIVIFILIKCTIPINEKFVNNPIIITDNFLNIKDKDNDISDKYIIVESTYLPTIIDKIKKTNVIDKNTIGDNTIPNNANIQLLIDPYINYYILNNNAPTSNFKEGIFVCVCNNILRKEDCLWNLYGKVVAYIYMSDYLFIQALIKGYNLNIDNISLKRIKIEDLKKTDKIFDYLFTYVVFNSEYMMFIFNQRYYINGLKDIDIHRIKAYYPFIKENYNSIKYYYNKTKRTITNEVGSTSDKDPNDIYLSSENSLLPIMSYNIISSVENFITRLDMPTDYVEAVKEGYDKSNKGGHYGCYGNGEIISKFECDSYYNIDGTPKKYYSLWDKKCSTDEECPYYKSNDIYPNNRGGCINNGFCEFPVGVKRLGFKKYTDTNLNKPLCYNCNNDKNNENNEGIKPADYVFENDFNERVKYKLNTIISLLDYRDL
jgi:hypothetical protein